MLWVEREFEFYYLCDAEQVDDTANRLGVAHACRVARARAYNAPAAVAQQTRCQFEQFNVVLCTTVILLCKRSTVGATGGGRRGSGSV